MMDRTNSQPTLEGVQQKSLKDIVIYALLIFIGLWIGLVDVRGSGVQWLEDGSRYANNGAMMRDWIVSGQYTDPYEFAKQNYTQYPAFSVPYHPPGYAFLLGLWFVVTGLSYESARVLIAIFLVGIGLGFFQLIRRQGGSREAACFAALLLVSSPELSRWARCTMSEIPCLFFIVLASLFYWRWYSSSKARFIWIAFGFATVAFFCRVTAAGVLPAWFLLLAIERSWKRLFSVHLILSALLFLVIGGAWAKFAASFARHEVRSSFWDRLVDSMSIDNFTVWIVNLPNMVGWGPLLVAIIALTPIAIEWGKQARVFFLLWFLSFYVFQILLDLHYESRYFMFVLPSLFGLIALAIDAVRSVPSFRYAPAILTSVLLGVNLFGVYHIPRGFIGYDRVAKVLSEQDGSGNVLMSSWGDSDLIFRYRCIDNKKRQMIRGDRTLAIRLSEYTGVDPIPIADETNDVLEAMRRGRCRYLVTSTSSISTRDNRPEDMKLAYRAANEHPDKFTLIDEFDLVFDYYRDRRAAKIQLWQFTEKLPPGKSELSIIIPTAQLKFPVKDSE